MELAELRMRREAKRQERIARSLRLGLGFGFGFGGGGGAAPDPTRIWSMNAAYADNFVNACTVAPTFTRADAAHTRFDSTGTLGAMATNQMLRTFDPSTLALQGFKFSEARTNGIRNNTMQGAVAGTPGTNPTNWSLASGGGLTKSIVGFGTVNGIAYIDVNYAGTATATSSTNLLPDTTTNPGAPAANGQTWTFSNWIALTVNSGATPTMSLLIHERDGTGAFLAQTSTPFTPNTTLTRYSTSRTNNNVSTAFELGFTAAAFTIGLSYDFTIRVGLPQLEQGANPTDVIQTTNAAVTRNADVDSLAQALSTQGTLIINAYGPDNDATRTLFQLDDGTANNRIALTNNSGVPHGTIVSGGVTQADLTSGTWTRGTFAKLGLSWSASGTLLYFNGSQIGSGGAITVPSTTTLRIGQNATPSGQPNQPIQYAALYNVAKNATQLAGLTK